MRLNVFGRELSVLREGERWRAFDIGAEGKRRPAQDIRIPAELPEEGISQYLADLLHEYASDRHPDVHVLD